MRKEPSILVCAFWDRMMRWCVLTVGGTVRVKSERFEIENIYCTVHVTCYFLRVCVSFVRIGLWPHFMCIASLSCFIILISARPPLQSASTVCRAASHGSSCRLGSREKKWMTGKRDKCRQKLFSRWLSRRPSCRLGWPAGWPAGWLVV